jgi:hypothetical protein
VDLSPSTPEQGIEKPQSHNLRGFPLLSMMDYLHLFAYTYNTICAWLNQVYAENKFLSPEIPVSFVVYSV